ncbi:MAG TPA: ACP S-malonyltransferase [Xanthomonadales bacterium]|nr:ACP S-malonyltransferase [Xanthomonadales bacterium]
MNSETVFLFPGQGSQSVGMLSDLYHNHSVAEKTFNEASDVLGYDLWDICQNGPETRLNQTEVTQPAMLAADVATWRIWCDLGGAAPTQMAGHSLGEYAALVAADSIDFKDAARLVSLRGKLMQTATPEGTGAMAAVLGLEDQQVEKICQDVTSGTTVSCANFNSPGQVVIAGHTGAVEKACEAAKAAGARRAILLPVSVPSHCVLMKGAAEQLSNALDDIEIRTPAIPVAHNIDGRSRMDPSEIRSALSAQLWQPVQWTATMNGYAAMGVSRMAECGPGKVLSGLARRVSRELKCTALIDSESISTTISDWSHS